MKQTWKEIQISKCIKTGNKNKWLKPLMLGCIVLIITFDRSRQYLNMNRKRLIGVGISFLIFMASNSFSTPAFQNETMVVMAEEQVEVKIEDTSLEMLEEEELSLEEEEIYYEEEPSLEGEEIYYEEELSLEGEEIYYEEEDKYFVDEILQNTDSMQIINNNWTEEDNGNFSKDDWNLILVNKQHPVPRDYTFELGTITANMKCDARILPELFAMLQAAKEDGVNLAVCSPYRDVSLQDVLFNRKIKLHMSRGDSYMDAYKKASQIVTVPGASEHQIGLALDIISDTYTVLDEGFANNEGGKWLKEHSKEYGFILRYPKGKEHITGIDFEPWHFRYVGKEAAAIIMDNELTLEEFVESISD